MSAATLVLGTDSWNAEVYSNLSVASTVAANFRDRAQVIQASWRLWRLNSKLKNFVDEINGILEGRITPPAHEPMSAENLQNAVFALGELHRMLGTINQLAKKRRLTNYGVIAGPLKTLERHTESIADIADWADAAIHQEQTNHIFDRAKQEKSFEFTQV